MRFKVKQSKELNIMENPHVHENLQHIQAVLSNYDTSFLSDDEQDYCPLCMETLDITDKNFKPCPCGYQICQFCYNNIRQNPELNGRCPACRRKYDDESVEYIVLSPEELKIEWVKQARKERERKQREKERKENEYANRKHLAGMRVIQKNLVYVIGLNPSVPYEEVGTLLRSDKYFGQYGKINKIVVNRKTGHNDHQTGYGIYVTFSKKEDAARCIQSVDGTFVDGRQVKAAYGTTKYCSSYLRGQPCPNPNCMFLHEPGEEVDLFNKRELSNKQQLQNTAPSTHVHSIQQPAQLKAQQHIQQHHMHHPEPFKTLYDSTATMPTGSNEVSAAASPAQIRAQLHIDDSSSFSTVAGQTPILTPAPLPAGVNPWGITQSSTPVSSLSKASSSAAFPTLCQAISNTSVTVPMNIASTAYMPITPNSNVKSKKNSDLNHEDSYDPLGSAVKFIDETINFLSDYHCINYRLRFGLIDDEVYSSYPSLFSFTNINVEPKSDGVLGRKLIDMLTIKPVERNPIMHYSQQEIFSQVYQHKGTEQNPPIQHVPSDLTPRHLNSELHLQSTQQQQNSTNNPPVSGMFIQNDQVTQIQSVSPISHSSTQLRSNNSTDLLNQLIKGKKVTANTQG